MTTPWYLVRLRKYAPMIALLCASAVANTILITFLLSEKYAASTLILITPQSQVGFSRAVSEKELLSFPVSPVGVALQTETSSKTYGELIVSRPVLEKVVRTLGLDKSTAASEESGIGRFKELLGLGVDLLKYGRKIEGDPLEEALGKLASQIRVAPTRNSYVFAIEVVWKEPRLAMEIANEAASAFVEFLGEISEGEAKGAREFLARRQREAATELDGARGNLREFKEQHRSVAFGEETAQEIALVAELEVSLEKANSRLAGLLKQFTIENPKVANLRAQRDGLTESIARHRAGLERLPDTESELASLELDVKKSEELYELITREYEEARIREGKRASDIRVVAPALAPLYPFRPIKIYYVGVALLLALLVGIACALLVDVLDTRLWNVEEARQALDLPVLATLPEVRELEGSGS